MLIVKARMSFISAAMLSRLGKGYRPCGASRDRMQCSRSCGGSRRQFIASSKKALTKADYTTVLRQFQVDCEDGAFTWLPLSSSVSNAV
jgi:hypothetical protein